MGITHVLTDRSARILFEACKNIHHIRYLILNLYVSLSVAVPQSGGAKIQIKRNERSKVAVFCGARIRIYTYFGRSGRPGAPFRGIRVSVSRHPGAAERTLDAGRPVFILRF
ncbi:MAG: hypothetical protein K2H77_01020 [Alistipes sp.]|nr:hypothetical protein [Alistipes sp.]